MQAAVLAEHQLMLDAFLTGDAGRTSQSEHPFRIMEANGSGGGDR
jgi:hypothetical protein